MAGQALSKLKKLYEQARLQELLFQRALKLYAKERESGLPPHKHKGARIIAAEVSAAHEKETGEYIKIDYSTVQRRYNGGRSMAEYTKARGHLNGEERECILEFLSVMSSRGFPLTHRTLREVINQIIRNRIPDFKGVGKNYISRFLSAHADRISSYWSSPLDDTRARAVNPHTIKAWFDLLEQVITEYGILPENIWGADESGFAPGVGQTERVIGASGKKSQYRQRSGVRENVTVMVTIGAGGTSIPPLVIFKGQHFLLKWLQNNPLNAVFGHSKKGWMTGEIGLEWIKHFDKHTAAQAKGAPRLLLVDGHVSHYTLELLQYAREHNIVVVCYPSHSTHVFQGLDVACFGRLKDLYPRYAGEHEDTTGQKITKEVFLTPFSRAYVETFTPETIKSAFSSTGVHPFNRDILTSDAIGPSLPTSIQGGLPMTLPDAVSLAAGMWDNTHIRADSPDWDVDMPEDTPPAQDVDHEMENGEAGTIGEGSGEERNHGDDAAADIVRPLVDGQGRRDLFREALAQTSASFLLGDSPITSHDQRERLPYYRLPPPPIFPSSQEPPTQRELELSRQLEEMQRREEAMMAAYRGSQAELVLADRHCTLLQSRLNAKESAAVARQEGRGKGRLMGDNLPKILTQGEFYDQSVRNREIEMAEQEAKRQREARNAAKKQLMDEWNERERVQKAADKEARRLWETGPLAEWEAENTARKAKGHKARWTKPKPPQRTKPIPKPQLPEEPARVAQPAMDINEREGYAGGEDDEEGNSSESEDENEGPGDEDE